ncbi:ribonuclease 3-like protein 3 [Bidens hawaiensis]|uniref:ribonuclease 3-like protein 3 n=1 Tax=Bidens hawaiensis TaxID=980011 RepID=UPI00404A8E05
MNDSTTESNSTILLPSLNKVETIIGYTFKNKELLNEAFTHNSYKDHGDPQTSNERLEYLGDSVLNLMFAKQQYFSYPKMKSGELTQLRAANVDTEALARVGFKHGLHRFLKHDDPSLNERVVKNLLEPLTTPENLSLNPVKKLNETCQKIGIKLEYKSLWIETGDIEVYKDNKLIGKGNKLIGKGNYKKKKTTAKNKAAADAYENLIKLFDI